MGWMTLDAVRCDRCTIYQPSYDVQAHIDGSTFCVSCGPPPVSIVVSRKLRRSPLAIAVAVCASIFALVVAIAELASG
jgi:hypothetical protein